MASDYIAAELTRIGAKPLPGQQDLFEPFEFTAGTKDAGSTLSVTAAGGAPQAFRTTAQVQALSFSDSAEASGSVVFAGYGLVVPDSQNFGYDSYAGLDVKDKVVVVLRYFPEDADQKTRSILARYSDLRYKAMAARQRGAKALLVLTGPRSPNAGNTIPMTFDTALAGSGIVAASINGDAGRAIFAAAKGKDLEAVQKEMDSGNPHAAGFAIPDVTVTVTAAVQRETQTGRNVVAYLPATAAATGVDRPWVALGAHYDHLGRGGHGNSLAEPGGGRPDPSRRGRQRVGHGGRARRSPRRCRSSRAGATCCWHSGRPRRSGSSARPRSSTSRPCRPVNWRRI